MKRRIILRGILAVIAARFVPSSDAKDALIGRSYTPTPEKIVIASGANFWYRCTWENGKVSSAYFSSQSSDTELDEIIWEEYKP